VTHTVPARPPTVKGERTRAKIVDTAAALIVKDGVAGLFEETHREISAPWLSSSIRAASTPSGTRCSARTARRKETLPSGCEERPKRRSGVVGTHGANNARETPNFAHVSWTAGVMSEMCGQFSLFLGVMAFAGTVQTRFQAAVPVGERLIGRATLERWERRKLFVNVTLTSSVTGTELATASGISIAVEMRNLRDRGEI
jgi:hypothetical protein